MDGGGRADIRPADDRELERSPIRVLAVIGDIVGRGLGQDFLSRVGQQRLVQIGHAFAVLGGNRQRLAEAKRERLVEPGLARATLGLVGDEEGGRSERRRVGKEWFSKGRVRGWPDSKKKKKKR